MKIRNLLEAFSPSMPKWLQNFIMYTKRGKKLSKLVDPEFLLFRDNRYRDVGRGSDAELAGNVIWNRRIDNNTGKPEKLDFSRANFINADVPNKIDDPILQDKDKLCFVYLKSPVDQTVWIPRVSSETERFKLSDERTIAMKQLNSKLLRNYCAGFCYIDLTDENNFTGERIDNRTQAKSGSVDRVNNPYEYNKNKGYFDPPVDKSGYLKIPVTKKYEKKLRELKISKVPEKLNKVRDNLVKLQKDIYDVNYNLISTDDVNWSDASDRVNAAYEKELQAIRWLKEAINQVNRLPSVTYDEWSLKTVQNRINSYLSSIEKNIDAANDLLKPYVLSSIDWDANDDNIYVDVEDDFE